MEMLAVHLGERKDSLTREAFALPASAVIATSDAQHCPPAGLSARRKKGVDLGIGQLGDSAGNASADDDLALGSFGAGSSGVGSERENGGYISMWANSARRSIDGNSRHSLDSNMRCSPKALQPPLIWPSSPFQPPPSDPFTQPSSSPFQQYQPASPFMRSSSIPTGHLATLPEVTLPGRVSAGQPGGNLSMMSLWPEASAPMELSCPHQVALARLAGGDV